MRVEKYLRLIAGFFILLSLGLSRVHSEYWLLFTAFVGLNLFQSGFTNWCLMMNILKLIFGKEKCEEIISSKSC
ncbi:MAG: DUF2892 domain-containing protein [Thermodesulfobacteriota bacterium]